MRVWIGSESGSQRILDAMQRGVTVEQVQRAVTLCKTERNRHGNVSHVGLRWENRSPTSRLLSSM